MNNKYFCISLISTFLYIFTYGQTVPQGFNYQAIVRDANGEVLANDLITVQFSIRTINANGTIVYRETHLGSTTDLGQVNLVIGNGTPNIGTFSGIDWASGESLFLQVELNTGNGLQDMGTQQLVSVPYAILANEAQIAHGLSENNAWLLGGNNLGGETTQYLGTSSDADISIGANNNPSIFVEGFNGSVTIGEPYQYVHTYDLMVNAQENATIRVNAEQGHSRLSLYTPLSTDEKLIQLTSGSSVGFQFKVVDDLFTIGGTTGNINGAIIMNGTNGNVAIGEYVDPLAPLHIGSSTGTDASLVTDASGYFIIGNVTGSNIVMDNNEIIARADGVESELYLNAEGGAVVINSVIGSTTHALYCNGTAAKPGGGSWTATSDARLKENVQPYGEGLTEVMQIEPVTYHYIEATGHDTRVEHVGVIAQQLQRVSPAMVSENPMELIDGTTNTYLSVDPSAFTYMLINAIKEQQQQIDALNERIRQLEKENE
jgi:Chaperone of endosialidase